VLVAEKRQITKPRSTPRSDRHGHTVWMPCGTAATRGGGGCVPQPPPKASAAQRTGTDCQRAPGGDGNRRRRTSQMQTPGADSSFLSPSPQLIRCTAHRRNGYGAATANARCAQRVPTADGEVCVRPPSNGPAGDPASRRAGFCDAPRGRFYEPHRRVRGGWQSAPLQVRLVVPPDYKRIGRARVARETRFDFRPQSRSSPCRSYRARGALRH